MISSTHECIEGVCKPVTEWPHPVVIVFIVAVLATTFVVLRRN